MFNGQLLIIEQNLYGTTSLSHNLLLSLLLFILPVLILVF